MIQAGECGLSELRPEKACLRQIGVVSHIDNKTTPNGNFNEVSSRNIHAAIFESLRLCMSF